MKKRFVFIGLILVLLILLTACEGSSNPDEIAVGSPAPDFTLSDSDGNPVSLASYQNQPVLLFFHMAGG